MYALQWMRRKARGKKREDLSRQFTSTSSVNSGHGLGESPNLSENDSEFQELLIAKRWESDDPRDQEGDLRGSRKKKIARSAVGSVDNLAAFVAPQNRTHLSGRHVKYQTRQKMKAPHTNWVSINDLGVVSKLAADKRAITKAKELGVTTRELRMFDQVYGHFHNNTTRILVRENALLFVMEGYRLIITNDETEEM